MRRIRITGAVAIALVAVSVAACGRSGSVATPAGEGEASATQLTAAAVPQVRVAAPEEASLEAAYEAPGSFIPYEEAGIAAEGAGP